MNNKIDYLNYYNQEPPNKSLADRVLELSQKVQDLETANTALSADNERLRLALGKILKCYDGWGTFDDMGNIAADALEPLPFDGTGESNAHNEN